MIVNWVKDNGYNIIDVNVLKQLPTQLSRVNITFTPWTKLMIGTWTKIDPSTGTGRGTIIDQVPVG